MASTTLKILREINNYSQEYIAEDVLGISQPTYARLEQDPSKISAAYAQKLADLYKVSIPNLLSEAPPIITFKDSINDPVNGNSGYFGQNTSNYHDGEVATLREQNALLIKHYEGMSKQNAELMELVKVLGGKLAG